MSRGSLHHHPATGGTLAQRVGMRLPGPDGGGARGAQRRGADRRSRGGARCNETVPPPPPPPPGTRPPREMRRSRGNAEKMPVMRRCPQRTRRLLYTVKRNASEGRARCTFPRARSLARARGAARPPKAPERDRAGAGEADARCPSPTGPAPRRDVEADRGDPGDPGVAGQGLRAEALHVHEVRPEQPVLQTLEGGQEPRACGRSGNGGGGCSARGRGRMGEGGLKAAAGFRSPSLPLSPTLQPPSGTRRQVPSNRRRLPFNRRRLPVQPPSVTRPTAVGYPPTAVGYPPTAVRYPPTAVGYPPTAVRYPRTAVGHPPTAFGTLEPPSVTLQPPAVTLQPPLVPSNRCRLASDRRRLPSNRLWYPRTAVG